MPDEEPSAVDGPRGESSADDRSAEDRSTEHRPAEGRPDDSAAPAASDREPSDEEVVRTAAEAAEAVIFSRYKQSAVRDVDVTVTFEDGILEVDVYLNAPSDGADPDRVADDAALAARSAVDELFGAE